MPHYGKLHCQSNYSEIAETRQLKGPKVLKPRSTSTVLARVITVHCLNLWPFPYICTDRKSHSKCLWSFVPQIGEPIWTTQITGMYKTNHMATALAAAQQTRIYSPKFPACVPGHHGCMGGAKSFCIPSKALSTRLLPDDWNVRFVFALNPRHKFKRSGPQSYACICNKMALCIRTKPFNRPQIKCTYKIYRKQCEPKQNQLCQWTKKLTTSSVQNKISSQT